MVRRPKVAASLIKDEERGESFLDTIIGITNNNTHELGFLRASVYEEALSLGRLWILVCEDHYCGHLLFGGALPTLHVKQLYVTPKMRSCGLARYLVDELVDYGEREGYSSIRARVASDLLANNAWERLGFSVVSVVSGGKSTGRMINCRFRRLNPRGQQTHMLGILDGIVNPSSLSARGMPVNRSHWYTLDINVWLDFALRRAPFYEAAHALIEGASRGGYRLRFTREAREEAQRNSKGRENDPLMAIAEAWQTLPELSSGEIDGLVERLREVIFPERSTTSRRAPNDLSDLRHVAMSIHSGATGFVTREKAILAQRETIQKKFAIEILSPNDLLEFHEPSLAPPVPLREGIKVDLLRQRWSAAATLVKAIAGRRARVRLLDSEDDGFVCSCGERLVGVLFWNKSRRGDVEANLVIEQAEDLDADTVQSVFDILIGLLVAEARTLARLHKILLRTDGDTRDRCYQDLRQIGFFDTSEHDLFLRFVSGDPTSLERWDGVKGIVDQELDVESEWLGDHERDPVISLRRSGSELKLDRFGFETFFGISALTISGRRAFYIPIREQYSQELLPRPWRPPLFHEHDASFRVERVYFRSPKMAGNLRSGDLLLWYVAQPIGALVGAARCTVSEVLDHGEAKERFRRLAVLDPSQIGPRVHCIAFDNYLHFPQRVTRQWLAQRGAIPSNNFVTVTPVPETLDLLQIIRAGFPTRG